jgi:uncharacterized protein (DUF849 family)
MGERFIINLAPTGMVPTREMTPKVPITPEEIVEQVLEAAALGVNMVHLHAREIGTGRPTYKKEIFAEIIQGIRRKNEKLVIGVSTSGRNFSEFAQRSEVLDLEGESKPDFASLTLSSLNFVKQASLNSPEMIQDLAQKMIANGIRPELEVFDMGMINYAKYLIKNGLIYPPFYFNMILGNIATAQADLFNLGLMIQELPEGALWSVGGFGPYQLPMNVAALIAGGGVRTGLEDNIWYDEKKTILATNRVLIERILNLAKALGRKPYSPEELRKLLQV